MSQAQVISLLLKDPENQRCCKCKVWNSEWVSVALAVFLCTRCAQELKSIDNNRAKVKSLLETLTQEELDYLIIGGNHAFTQYVSQHLSLLPVSQQMTDYAHMLAATAHSRHVRNFRSGRRAARVSAVICKFGKLFDVIASQKSLSSVTEDTHLQTATEGIHETQEI